MDNQHIAFNTISNSFKHIKDFWKKYVLSTILSSLVCIGLIFYFIFATTQDYVEDQAFLENITFDSSILMYSFFILSFLVYVLMAAVYIKITDDNVEKRKTGAIIQYSYVFNRYPRMIFASLMILAVYIILQKTLINYLLTLETFLLNLMNVYFE